MEHKSRTEMSYTDDISDMMALQGDVNEERRQDKEDRRKMIEERRRSTAGGNLAHSAISSSVAKQGNTEIGAGTDGNLVHSAVRSNMIKKDHIEIGAGADGNIVLPARRGHVIIKDHIDYGIGENVNVVRNNMIKQNHIEIGAGADGNLVLPARRGHEVIKDHHDFGTGEKENARNNMVDQDHIDGAAEEEKEKRRRIPTQKGREYQISILDSRRRKTASRLLRKGKMIEDLLYSPSNIQAVKEQLNQMDDIFKLIEETQHELISLDVQFSDDDWFDHIDEQVFSVKYKAHAWLRETEEADKKSVKSDGSSKRSSKSGSSKGSKSSSNSSSRRKHCSYNIKDQVIKEKMKVAELIAEQTYMEKKKAAEYESKYLEIQQQMAKAQARVKVLAEAEEESVADLKYRNCEDWKLPSSTLRPKENEENQFQKSATTNGNIDSLAADFQGNKLMNNLDDLNTTYSKQQAAYKQIPVEIKYTEGKEVEFEKQPYSQATVQNIPTNNQTTADILCQLLKQQSAPDVDIEVFDGNLLNFKYFTSIFKEVVESKIEDPRGRLTRLIRYTSGEAKELVKNCIYLPPGQGYQNAMEMLQARYGDPHKIMAAYRKEIKEWPSVKPGDSSGFRKFFNFLVKCRSLLSEDKISLLINNPDVMCMLLSKLPGYMQDRWNRKVYTIRETERREAELTDLINMVDIETKLVNDPLFSREAVSRYSGKQDKGIKGDRRKIKTFLTGATDGEDQFQKGPRKCLLCDKNHDLESCPVYMSKSMEERSKLIFKNKLCYGCLQAVSKDHNAKNCKKRRSCKVCNEKHLTSLHGYKFEKKGSNEKVHSNQTGLEENDSNNEELSVTATYTGAEVVSMCVVPIKIKHGSSAVLKTHALLDSCSQGTFIDEKLLEDLKVTGRNTNITVKTLNGEKTERSMMIEGLEVANVSKGKEKWLNLPKTYARKKLSIENEMLSPEQISKWKYLDAIKGEVCTKRNTKIGVLIGANCSKALEPEKVISSQNGGPYAFKTMLGWCIVGTVNAYRDNKIECHRTAVYEADTKQVARHHFEIEKKFAETEIKEMINKMYESDFTEPKLENKSIMGIDELSIEDKKFLALLDKETKMVDGHYQVPLPFKEDRINFPDNRNQALKRLNYLKKKFSRQEKFSSDYKTFIEDMLRKGYAEESKTSPKTGKCWYIPHHGVYHPKKPDKIRVVFDCSAELEGKSLNRALMSGPDLTNQIVGVLLKFRQENVAFMADIEAMFYQVKVPPEQRSFMRFLWWENSDTRKQILEYEMCAHVFGGTSSPSCSNYALKRTAADNQNQYGKNAADTLRKKFYIC